MMMSSSPAVVVFDSFKPRPSTRRRTVSFRLRDGAVADLRLDVNPRILKVTSSLPGPSTRDRLGGELSG